MLRLPCVAPPRAARNLWDAGNLLLQKFPAPDFTVTARLTFHALNEGERTGLVVMGTDYATLVVERRGTELVVSQRVGMGASTGGAEKEVASRPLGSRTAFLRAKVAAGGRTEFSFG